MARRRRSGWWQEPAGWALALAVVFPSGLAAIPVSKHASGWVAVAAEVAGLAILVASAVGFFVVKRNSWLLAAPLAFGVSFSLFLALIEGWVQQVNSALSIASVVLVIGVAGAFVASVTISTPAVRRLNRAMKDLALDASEKIAHEGLFRDDGERITIYANRGRLLLRFLTGIAALALIVGGLLWARTIAGNVFWQVVIDLGIGFLLLFGGVPTLLTLIRIGISDSTLVVNADGILDNCSMIVTGRGLLRWNETLDVDEFTFSPNKLITYHFLDINVTDARAIRRRQPLLKRALAIFATERQQMGFRIPRPFLDRPAAALAAEINRYINTHAPEGS